MKRPVLIGVDGGGTKTHALAADLDGIVLGQGVGGPSNYHAVGIERACAALEIAMAQALEASQGEPAAICLGLAGAARQNDTDRFRSWAQASFPDVPLRVVSDAEILLAAGAPTGAGLALICGTGSIAYGRTVEEDLVRAGGWGYLFGDEGSGYAIGAAALRAVMQAEDGRGKATLLTGLVLSRRQVRTPPGLINSIYGADVPRVEIADLADLVEQAADQGDDTARAILEDAGRDLALTLRAVYRKLGSENTPVPLALSGGTIVHGSYLSQAFRRACSVLGLVFASVTEVPEPAAGAILLARQLLLAR